MVGAWELKLQPETDRISLGLSLTWSNGSAQTDGPEMPALS